MANQRAASGNAKNLKPSAPLPVPSVPAAPAPVASFRLFRKCDWLAAAAAAVIAMTGYLVTMAPNVTLEDSGELITGAHTMGVPHPPGYPIWTVLGFVFEHLNPLSPQPVPDYVKADGLDVSRRNFNIAWRVNFMSGVFGATAAGLLALLISRSGSMLLRSAKLFHESLTDEQEEWIAAVCGTVGALIFAYSPVPWSQAVIGEVYTLNGLFMAVTLVMLFIWMHDPQRDKYLYWTCFLWALGLTNHQTLLFMAPAYFIMIALVSVPVLMDALVGVCWVVAVGQWFMEWVLDDATFFTQSSYFWGGAAAMVAPAAIWMVGEVLSRLFGWPTRINWKRAAILAACVLGGLLFYGYSPLASSTNPPMNWGFTQNKDGFWHHITRGQYEKVQIYREWSKFWHQMAVFFNGLQQEYTSMFVAVGAAALAWFYGTAWRARKWLIFTAAGIFFTSVTFIVLANPTLDRAVLFNDRVFFMLTHALFCAWIGYGLIWGMAVSSVHFDKLRWLLYGVALLACMMQLVYQVVVNASFVRFVEHFFNMQLHLLTASEICAALWVLIQLGIIFGLSIIVLLAKDNKLPLMPILALVACMPVVGMLRNWSDNEQHGHMFGWYFGYHMFAPGGGYPSMDKDAILYGGTDPGRFVPTYEIFCPRVRPDVYIITQNALAENTYLRYLRYQYCPVRKCSPMLWVQDLKNRKAFVAKLQRPADPVSVFLQQKLSPAIRQELDQQPADGDYSEDFLKRLLSDVNQLLLGQWLYEPQRFAAFSFPEEVQKLIQAGPQAGGSSYLNRRLLERVYAGEIGAIEDRFNLLEKSLGRDTTYPKEDIYISNDEDSADAIRTYIEELKHRPALPGELVQVVGGRVNIQGVQAVTALNGLVSKQIFDKEHYKRSFYVEESFVIQWMYNYLEPYGVIMKIDRDPLPKITPDMVARNHKYWTDYIEKYLEHNPAFWRDDDAERAFSKLRTAHAGLYAWRVTMAPPEQRQPELANEAVFAFDQAIHLCPFNVEATFRYAEFLTRLERYDDALKLVDGYKKHDPYNSQVGVVLNQINNLKQVAVQEGVLRRELQNSQGDLNKIMQFLSVLAARGKFPEMDSIIDRLIENKELPAQPFKMIAQTYVQLGRFDRVEKVLGKYLGFHADDAQGWYDYAVVEVQLQHPDPSLDALEKAIRILGTSVIGIDVPGPDGKMVRLTGTVKQIVQQDPRFTQLRLFPRFQQMTQ